MSKWLWVIGVVVLSGFAIHEWTARNVYFLPWRQVEANGCVMTKNEKCAETLRLAAMWHWRYWGAVLLRLGLGRASVARLGARLKGTRRAILPSKRPLDDADWMMLKKPRETQRLRRGGNQRTKKSPAPLGAGQSSHPAGRRGCGRGQAGIMSCALAR